MMGVRGITNITFLILLSTRSYGFIDSDIDIDSFILENLGLYIDFKHFGLYYDENFIIKYRMTINDEALSQKDKNSSSIPCEISLEDETKIKTTIKEQLEYVPDPNYIRSIWCEYKNLTCLGRQKRFIGAALLGAGLFVEGVLSSYNLIHVKDLEHDFKNYKVINYNNIVHLNNKVKILMSNEQRMINYIENIHHNIELQGCKVYAELLLEKLRIKMEAIAIGGNGKITSDLLPIHVLRQIMSTNVNFDNHIFKDNPSLFYATSRSILIHRDDNLKEYDYMIIIPKLIKSRIAKIYEITNVGWEDQNRNFKVDLPTKVLSIKSKNSYYPFEYDNGACTLTENVMICNTRSTQFNKRSLCLQSLFLEHNTSNCDKYVISGKIMSRSYNLNHGLLLVGQGPVEYMMDVDDIRKIFHKKVSINHHHFIPYSNFSIIKYDNQLYHTKQITGNYSYIYIAKVDTNFIPKDKHFYSLTNFEDIDQINHIEDPLNNPYTFLHTILFVIIGVLFTLLLISISILYCKLNRNRKSVKSVIKGLQDASLIS